MMGVIKSGIRILFNDLFLCQALSRQFWIQHVLFWLVPRYSEEREQSLWGRCFWGTRKTKPEIRIVFGTIQSPCRCHCMIIRFCCLWIWFIVTNIRFFWKFNGCCLYVGNVYQCNFSRVLQEGKKMLINMILEINTGEGVRNIIYAYLHLTEKREHQTVIIRVYALCVVYF